MAVVELKPSEAEAIRVLRLRNLVFDEVGTLVRELTAAEDRTRRILARMYELADVSPAVSHMTEAKRVEVRGRPSALLQHLVSLSMRGTQTSPAGNADALRDWGNHFQRWLNTVAPEPTTGEAA